MKRPLSQKRFAALITAACLAMTATGVLLLVDDTPAPHASAKTEAPATTVLPVGATDKSSPPALTTENTPVTLPSVSVRGEVITAHLATVPDSVWQESTPAQPPYAVPAPDYDAFARQPPTPGVPIIDSPLRPADDAAPDNSEK